MKRLIARFRKRETIAIAFAFIGLLVVLAIVNLLAALADGDAFMIIEALISLGILTMLVHVLIQLDEMKEDVKNVPYDVGE